MVHFVMLPVANVRGHTTQREMNDVRKCDSLISSASVSPIDFHLQRWLLKNGGNDSHDATLLHDLIKLRLLFSFFTLLVAEITCAQVR